MKKDITNMTLNQAMKIVLAELKDRLPKTNLDGFVADKKVYEAMMILKEYHEELGEFEGGKTNA